MCFSSDILIELVFNSCKKRSRVYSGTIRLAISVHPSFCMEQLKSLRKDFRKILCRKILMLSDKKLYVFLKSGGGGGRDIRTTGRSLETFIQSNYFYKVLERWAEKDFRSVF